MLELLLNVGTEEISVDYARTIDEAIEVASERAPMFKEGFGVKSCKFIIIDESCKIIKRFTV